jgi:hypothetical protein
MRKVNYEANFWKATFGSIILVLMLLLVGNAHSQTTFEQVTKDVTAEECKPTPWVTTDPKTGVQNGIIIETFLNPPDSVGLGTCQYKVKFGDRVEYMVTLSKHFKHTTTQKEETR